MIRVGNNEYSGDSYGLTTLLDDHVDIGVNRLAFRFVGKSGKLHDVVLSDRRVACVVRQCQELPGQQLLQYVDGDTIRGIGLRDVNQYIREVTHTDFTAKTFRTWGGIASGAQHLRALDPPTTVAEATAQVRGEAVKATAERLRNTPTVCRSSYVHPAVIEAHVDGSIHAAWAAPEQERGRADDHEICLLDLLERRL